MKAIVSDFDDTLFFTDDCIKLASKDIVKKELSRKEVRKLNKDLKTKIYKHAYSKHSDLLKPNLELISLYKQYLESKWQMIILSARGEGLLKYTESSLKKHKIPYNEVILRKDVSGKDEEWKNDMLRKLSEKYDEILYFDDKKENLDYIRERLNKDNVKCILVEKTNFTYCP